MSPVLQVNTLYLALHLLIRLSQPCVQAAKQVPTELVQLTNAPAHVYLADSVQEILMNVQASVQPEGMELDLRNNVPAHAVMVHTRCLVMQLVKRVLPAHLAHPLGSVARSVQV